MWSKSIHRWYMAKKLARFLDGEATIKEASSVQDHLRQCRLCQEERRAILKLRTSAMDAMAFALTEEETRELESGIEKEFAREPISVEESVPLKPVAERRWWGPLWKPALALLALLMVVTIPLLRYRHVPSNEACIHSLRSDRVTVFVLQTEPRGITVLLPLEDKKVK